MTERHSDKVGDVLRAATDYLAGRDAYQPRQTCELLMSRLLGCGRLQLYVKFESRLTAGQLEALRRGVRRLAAGEPAQYIAGSVEFMGHVFKVDRRALIPRPETESLVENVLACEEIKRAERPLIADMGCGCGCIVASLALAMRNGAFVAIDTSADALQLAAENVKALGLTDRIGFEADLADAAEPDSLDAVVANLPYIPTPQWERLPVHIRNHEPRSALDGGVDGLSVMREVVPETWIVLRPGGRLFLEIGDGQKDCVAKLLEESDFGNVVAHRDLAGKDRVIEAVKKPLDESAG